MFISINNNFLDKDFKITQNDYDAESFSYVSVESQKDSNLHYFHLVRSDGNFACISNIDFKKANRYGFFDNIKFIKSTDIKNGYLTFEYVKLQFMYDETDKLFIVNVINIPIGTYVNDSNIFFSIVQGVRREPAVVKFYSTLPEIKEKICSNEVIPVTTATVCPMNNTKIVHNGDNTTEITYNDHNQIVQEIVRSRYGITTKIYNPELGIIIYSRMEDNNSTTTTYYYEGKIVAELYNTGNMYTREFREYDDKIVYESNRYENEFSQIYYDKNGNILNEE